MSGLIKKLQPLKRQLAKSGLSLSRFKLGKTVGKGRRAEHLNWRISRFRLAVSLRYFKTSKATRSKLQKQVVLRTYFLPFKELALTWTKTKRRAKCSQLRFTPKLQFASQNITLLLILVSIVSSIYFVTQLGSSKKVVLAAPKPVTAVAKPPAPPKPKVLPRSEPTQIRISKIDMDAPMVAVGYRPDGSMQVPGIFDTAGWYKYSPTPGELGPAIIDGHLDSVKGPAIFWRLNELAPGDIIEVGRTDNTTAKFRVDDIKQYPQAELPMQDIYGNINYSGIRLITCGGVFNVQTRHYSHNTVVFGSLVI